MRSGHGLLFYVNVSSSRLNCSDSFTWAEYFSEGVVSKRRFNLRPAHFQVVSTDTERVEEFANMSCNFMLGLMSPAEIVPTPPRSTAYIRANNGRALTYNSLFNEI